MKDFIISEYIRADIIKPCYHTITQFKTKEAIEEGRANLYRKVSDTLFVPRLEVNAENNISSII